jgi:hypothetical protein
MSALHLLFAVGADAKSVHECKLGFEQHIPTTFEQAHCFGSFVFAGLLIGAGATPTPEVLQLTVARPGRCCGCEPKDREAGREPAAFIRQLPATRVVPTMKTMEGVVSGERVELAEEALAGGQGQMRKRSHGRGATSSSFGAATRTCPSGFCANPPPVLLPARRALA